MTISHRVRQCAFQGAGSLECGRIFVNSGADFLVPHYFVCTPCPISTTVITHPLGYVFTWLSFTVPMASGS